MHLLEIDKKNYIGQADPFVFETNGRFYIYTTGDDGIYAYDADDLLGKWTFRGKVFTFPNVSEFWAPSVIEHEGMYYLYCSFEFYGDTPDKGGHRQAMHVAKSESPLGPFVEPKQLLHPFSIDSHVVENEAGMFIFYSTNTFDGERPGTYIVVDRLIAPDKAEGNPVTMIVPTLDEDVYMYDRYKKGVNWHTIEGAFYFREGEWQYLMYSGNCYQRPSYYIGYARAKTDESDLTKIKFEKYPDPNTYHPVIKANEFEEGTGHHSMIKYKGEWYAVYHARDVKPDGLKGDRRNARICRLHINDGIITAERYENHI